MIKSLHMMTYVNLSLSLLSLIRLTLNVCTCVFECADTCMRLVIVLSNPINDRDIAAWPALST